MIKTVVCYSPCRSSALRLQLLLLVQCLLLWQCVQSAGTYYFFCEVTGEESIVTLEWNTEAASYQLKNDGNNNDNERRIKRTAWKDAIPVWVDDTEQDLQTAAASWSTTSMRMQMTLASESQSSVNKDPHHRRLNDDNDSPPYSNNNNNKNHNTIIQGRVCPCSENPSYPDTAYYCAADKTYCAVPASYYQHPESPLCLNLQSDEIFARSIWPVVMIWFCLSAIFCICTAPGRRALEFIVVTTCWPTYNTRIIQAWIDRQPGRAHELWRRHWDRQRFRHYHHQHGGGGGSGGNAARNFLMLPWLPWYSGASSSSMEGNNSRHGGGRKVEFILKTCRYHATTTTACDATREECKDEHDDDQDDDQRACCSICIIPLEEGDRVGKLQCGHLFHSECIKGWIQRRNACPLCLQEDIAVPRHFPVGVEAAPPPRTDDSIPAMSVEAYL